MDPKILIIEDNEQDQKIISRFLGKNGFPQVLTADSGEQGLDLARRERFDIILIDTLLPGMNGFETCQALKAMPGACARIIMMTGRMDAVDADRARQMGADDYCVKTSDCAGVLEAFKNVLGRLPKPEPVMTVVPKPETGGIPEKGLSEWGLEKTNQAIKALYRELEKKNEELKELDNLKSEFVSMVSHELRTPLTIIKGAISQVIDGVYGEISAVQKEKLAMALRGANLLRRIIDDLLDIAKLEAKNVKLDRVPFDFVGLVQEVAAGFMTLVTEKGLAFKMECPAGPLMIEADRDRVLQVLTNLVGNSLKFTEKGGITIGVKDTPHSVDCSVQDTGRGIAEEDKPKVFDRFQQFGKSFAPGHEGTGLGLAISKNIIELHNGRIWFQSELGKGSTFTFHLPKKSQ